MHNSSLDKYCRTLHSSVNKTVLSPISKTILHNNTRAKEVITVNVMHILYVCIFRTSTSAILLLHTYSHARMAAPTNLHVHALLYTFITLHCLQRFYTVNQMCRGYRCIQNKTMQMHKAVARCSYTKTCPNICSRILRGCRSNN